MGHTTAKTIYRDLGEKIDNLTVRAPWNDALYEILKALYSPEEAEAVIRMPYGLSSFDRLKGMTGMAEARLAKLLERLCAKGLVMDLWLDGQYLYTPSPLVIGIFEFTMMRTAGQLAHSEWARRFYDYMEADDAFYAANFAQGEKVSIIRALPYEAALHPDLWTEVLDYEKATAIIERADTFAIGQCACRHEKLHLGKKTCDVPLDTCSAFGPAADYLIRHHMAEPVSKSAMLENLARSQEMGLVLNADNVRRNVTFICHCCRCCCNVMLGVTQFGFPNTLVTSNYIAALDQDLCVGCGKCAAACPIDAIGMQPVEAGHKRGAGKIPQVDRTICLGCGVCALNCSSQALRLVARGQRVLHPSTTFERVILQCLERGTLQNQLFDDPASVTQGILRGVIGGFLRLSPVKKALMSDLLRSSFLNALQTGVAFMGKRWLTDI